MTLRFSPVPIVITAVVLAGALAAAPAAAQSTAAQFAQAGETERDKAPAAESVTTEEIQTYARATTKVQFIRRDFETQKRTASPQQVAQLAESANVQMIEAVEQEGLSVDRFNEISEAADADPVLKSRILEHIDKQKQ